MIEHINAIVTKTHEIITTFFDIDCIVSSRCIRYEYVDDIDVHLCDVEFTFKRNLCENDVRNICDIMRELNNHDDVIDDVSFVVNNRKFIIGDGDDSLATRFDNGKLIVWVRALQ